MLQNSGHLSAEAAGLVGLFLGTSSIISAFYELYLWIDIIIALVIIIATFFWEYWINARKNYEQI